MFRGRRLGYLEAASGQRLENGSGECTVPAATATLVSRSMPAVARFPQLRVTATVLRNPPKAALSPEPG